MNIPPASSSATCCCCCCCGCCFLATDICWAGRLLEFDCCCCCHGACLRTSLLLLLALAEFIRICMPKSALGSALLTGEPSDIWIWFTWSSSSPSSASAFICCCWSAAIIVIDWRLVALFACLFERPPAELGATDSSPLAAAWRTWNIFGLTADQLPCCGFNLLFPPPMRDCCAAAASEPVDCCCKFAFSLRPKSATKLAESAG